MTFLISIREKNNNSKELGVKGGEQKKYINLIFIFTILYAAIYPINITNYTICN